MKRRLGVYLGAQALLVGRPHYSRDGAREGAVFEFNDAWQSASGILPIDPTLPLVRAPHFHKVIRDGSLFHPAIADTEPDRRGMTVIRLRETAHSSFRSELGACRLCYQSTVGRRVQWRSQHDSTLRAHTQGIRIHARFVHDGNA